MSQQELALEIRKLVANLPRQTAESLATSIAASKTGNKQRLKVKLLGEVAQPGFRKRVNIFLDAWESVAPDVSCEAVALGIMAAAEVEEYYGHYQTLELVWTGPESKSTPFRRTDQALLELIDEAEHHLHIVSYAVYKAKSIYEALSQAAKRGVSISIYLETPEASEGKMTANTIRALGKEVAENSRIFIWPFEKREQTVEGKYGSLHAKIAVADGQVMLISSANLTEYAMKLNMEMGLLTRGGPLPGRVRKHLTRLVEQGTFVLVG